MEKSDNINIMLGGKVLGTAKSVTLNMPVIPDYFIEVRKKDVTLYSLFKKGMNITYRYGEINRKGTVATIEETETGYIFGVVTAEL